MKNTQTECKIPTKDRIPSATDLRRAFLTDIFLFLKEKDFLDLKLEQAYNFSKL